jgi:hypothetical protein
VFVVLASVVARLHDPEVESQQRKVDILYPRSPPEQLWCPPSFVVNGYRRHFPGLKRLGCDVDHSYLAPRLRMSGSIPLLLLYAFMMWTGITLPFSLYFKVSGADVDCTAINLL